MKKHLSLAAAAAAPCSWQAPLRPAGRFGPLDSTAAAPATLGQYTLTAFGDDLRLNGGVVSDVASPLGGVVGFSGSDQLEVGAGGDGQRWLHGDVYFTTGSRPTLFLQEGTGAFYFFASPIILDVLDHCRG